MIKKIQFWLTVTRSYALPMSILSWFVAFCYSITQLGNTIYGLIALLGICIAHLAANMLDDYVDFKTLPKIYDEDNNLKLENAQEGKCSYILNSSMTTTQLLIISIIFFMVASSIGIYFAIKVGIGAIIFMCLGGILAVLYPLLGRYRLCELAIGLIYGPYIFGGVNYVMTGHYDWHTLIVSIPSALMTVNMLYTDTLLDYDLDKKQGKKTLANYFPSKWDSLNFQKVLLTCAYVSVLFTAIFDIADWQVFLTFATIPMAINLLDSMKIFIIDKQEIPNRKVFEGFMEYWDDIVEEGSVAFMLRMYQARNLMVCNSLIFGVVLLLYS